jgi:hypothetical protein
MEQSASKSAKVPWWKPHPLTYAIVALAGWCATLGWIGLHRQVTGNDPGGNGMATGFVQGFAELGLQLTAVMTGLYLLIRWRPVRYVLAALLLLLSLGMIILVK